MPNRQIRGENVPGESEVANPGWEQWAVFRAYNPFITARRA